MDSTISQENGISTTLQTQNLLLGLYIGRLTSNQSSFCDDCASKALDQLIDIAQSDSTEDLLAQVLAGLSDQHVDSEQPSPYNSTTKRIAVECESHKRIISVDDITYISTNGSNLDIHTNEEAYQVRKNMKTLEDHLDPDQFYRIHRSHIISLNQVEALINESHGSYSVRLKVGVTLPVSRTRRGPLVERLKLLP